MSLSIDIEKKGSYLHVHVSGFFNLHEAKRQFGKILLACDVHDLSKVLVDFRGVSGKSLPIDRVVYVRSISSLHDDHLQLSGRPLKIAFVGPDTLISPDDYAARESGSSRLDVLSTTELADACNWLDIDTSTAE